MDATYATQLSDHALLTETARAACHERDATARLIALLAELDARKLYLGESCPSMFVYCTRMLRMSEHAAYERISAARASRMFPDVLKQLADGSLTLATVNLLRPHVTADNCEQLLEAARNKSKRDVERLVAAIVPQPDIASSVRKLPNVSPQPKVAVPSQTAHAAVVPSVSAPTVVVPVAPERYLLRVTVGEATHRKLKRAQDLMRHTVPNGDPAEVIDRALTLLVEHLERTRTAKRRLPERADSATPPTPEISTASADSSGTRTRHVPASVTRAVWARDDGLCAFVGANGRCGESGFLELHHVVPFAAGGASTLENLELRCRAHNAYEAELFFGERTDELGPGRAGERRRREGGEEPGLRQNRLYSRDGGP